MKHLIVILTVLLLAGSVYAVDWQLMFIYRDTEFHARPADKASVPVIHTETGDTAWAGAMWVNLDEDFSWLAQRDYCIAWEVRLSGEFEQFLSDHGYQRLEEPEGP